MDIDVLNQEDVENLYEHDMLVKFKKLAEEMEERVLKGEVIKEYVCEDGERILLTKTDRGTFGYALFEPNKKEPHHLFESQYLFTDFEKQTAYNGVGLRYFDAKSRISRNLLGYFFEYSKEPNFEAFYLNIQMPKDADIKVTQQSTGHYDEDPVVIIGAYFDRKQFDIGAYAQEYLDEVTGKPTIRVGLGGFTSDGFVNHDQMYENAVLAEEYKKLFGGKYMTEDRLIKVMGSAIDLSQATFGRLFNTIGITTNPDIEPNHLIEDSLKRYMGKTQDSNFLLESNDSIINSTEKHL